MAAAAGDNKDGDGIGSIHMTKTSVRHRPLPPALLHPSYEQQCRPFISIICILNVFLLYMYFTYKYFEIGKNMNLVVENSILM